MKRTTVVATIAICLSVGSAGWAYDAEMAKSYAELFSPVVGAQAGKALHFMSAEDFAKRIQAGNDFVAIDIRTPAETAVLSLSLPNSLVISADQMFLPENLDRIPTDRPVIIVCKSGMRATAIGTSLRHVGFDNVYILKGGLQGLAGYYGPKQANPGK